MSAVRPSVFEPALLRSALLALRSVDAERQAEHDPKPLPFTLPIGSGLTAPVSWLEQAACRGRPTSWWYPAKGDSFAFAVAKSVCSSCPVRAACLDDALAFEADSGFSAGVRGGLTAERRAIMLGRRPSR